MQYAKDNEFSYDIRAISESHAGLTANIAGFALAMLLILPVFGGKDAIDFLNRVEVINALLFFFSSLVFGIIASALYSVASGDNRSENSRLIGFIGPSIAFGLAVPLLLLGFLYVINAYLGGLYAVSKVLRIFIIVTLWLVGSFIIRTIDETFNFINGPSLEERWYRNRNTFLYSMLALGSIPAWLRAFREFTILEPSIILSEGYFVSLLGLVLIGMIYNMWSAYRDLEFSDLQKAFTIARILELMFIVFVVVTLVIYV